jgi:hypothetical protein
MLSKWLTIQGDAIQNDVFAPQSQGHDHNAGRFISFARAEADI